MNPQNFIDFTNPVEILRWCWANYGNRAAIGTSLQGAGLVIMHMAYTNDMPFPVFTIDTGILFNETLELKKQVEELFGIQIESLAPDLTLAEQAEAHGQELWLRDPDLCCYLRKVLPLERKLESLDVWITGVRRDQSVQRSQTGLVEPFQSSNSVVAKNILKVSPLAEWSRAEVDVYLSKNKIPTNTLLERGYRSIGCRPCTAPVSQNQDERAGRWRSFSKMECGIHTFFKNSDAEKARRLKVADSKEARRNPKGI